MTREINMKREAEKGEELGWNILEEIKSESICDRCDSDMLQYAARKIPSTALEFLTQ